LKNPYSPFIASVAWLIISIILLTLPGTAFPEEDWLGKIWFDKWVHIGMFAIMVVLWCLAWKSLKPTAVGSLKKAFIIIAIASLTYGTAMEFVQLYLIAFRSFDFGDIVADAVGCTAGWLFSTRRYIKK
jgi:VanZ family protein